MRSQGLRTRKRAWVGALVAGVAAAAVLLAATSPLKAATRKHVHVDGNRTMPVHLIPLYDEYVTKIRSDDSPAAPWSPKETCGDCHDYEKIKMGWHFNSSLNITKAGRPGEPWVLADDNTQTQLPLSYRGWEGTYKPDAVGLTQWEFVKMFGRHMPGGDAGEKEEETADINARWDISGLMEIDCLTCHNAAPDQNATASVIQVARENLRWAPTAASGLGIVKGIASRLPDGYTFINGHSGNNGDNAWAAAPEVYYKPSRFDKNQNVFFDITNEPPANRCYFCHSTIAADFEASDVWTWDKDVHMAAGLACSTCHRNGLGHDIVRGYEGENGQDATRSGLTCRGCHMGDGTSGDGISPGGRLGAPKPLHKGLPAVHIEKISCTGCHSGLLPKDKVGRVKTARANRLGIHGRAVWDTATPFIMGPVFVRNDDGKIEPRNVMWPAFWGASKNGQVTPVSFAVATAAVTKIRDEDAQAKFEEEKAAKAAAEAAKPIDEQAADANAEKPADDAAEPAATDAATKEVAEEGKEPAGGAEKIAEGETAPAPVEVLPEPDMTLTEPQIGRVLAALGQVLGEGATPVYVSGGKVYEVAGLGLKASDNGAAEPYSWPLGHDVRPAAQALGAGGCTDCHSDDSPFFYASVSADGPTALPGAVTTSMHQFEEVTPGLLEALESFAFLRTGFLICGLVIGALLALALVHYGFTGLESFLRGKLKAEPEETV